MRKTKIQIALFTGMALMAVSPVSAEEILAGWDNGILPWFPNRPADTQAADITASVFFSSNITGTVSSDWSTVEGGSYDETFGSFAGAVSLNVSNVSLNASLALTNGVYSEYTFFNTGTNNYELSAFRFDVWRVGGGSGQATVVVLPGGGITAGDLGAPVLGDHLGVPPASGADYDDVDLSLTHLVDYTLSVGQSVTFRIECTGTGIFIDNIALTGTSVTPPFVRKRLLAGWDDGVKPWQNPSQDANFTAQDIVASVVYVNTTNGPGDGWGIQSAGSYDETFGTFPGAAQVSTPNALIAASNAKLVGSQAEYTVTNTGTVDYVLASFHFDVWRSFLNNGQFAAEVLPGGGITAGVLGETTLPNRGGPPPATNADYADVDFVLTGLADYTLAAGESVTFRIESILDPGTFLDNVGVTSLEEFLPPVLSITADTIRFDTATAALYTLFGRTDLVTGPGWQPITNFMGTGGMIEYSYAATNAMEFFIVEGESL